MKEKKTAPWATKAQIALEYLLITGFLLIAAGIIFIYSITILDQNLRFAKADKALQELASAADRVSDLGPGNKVFVELELPTDIASNQITAENREISLTLNTPFGPNTRYETTSGNLKPTTIAITGGIKIIKVEMVDQNVVFTEV
ncbi:MAG: hypothetical protein HYW50_01950 [Candidatus Diapherotrites archaeon]|nr:hypothetical protein [Candidatus Diapherotrites archaeon]